MKRFARPSPSSASFTPRARFESLEDRRHLSASPFVANVSRLVSGEIVGGNATAARNITISNPTDAPVMIPLNGLSIGGSATSQFQLTNPPTGEVVLRRRSCGCSATWTTA
jgi:hypothetical protein